jgi:hypothetical protein
MRHSEHRTLSLPGHFSGAVEQVRAAYFTSLL